MPTLHLPAKDKIPSKLTVDPVILFSEGFDEFLKTLKPKDFDGILTFNHLLNLSEILKKD